MTENCSDCKFHQDSTQGWGQCRFNPPTVFQEDSVTSTGESKVIYVSRYPYVHPQFSCSKFRAK